MYEWTKYSVTSENIGIYEQIFEDVEIFDCHTHIGKDRDGRKITADKLIKEMDAHGIKRVLSFALNDDTCTGNFHEANDLILAASKKYEGRILPFFRLDPHKPWKEEFALRASQGFRGIKLHPKSQNFKLTFSKVMEIFKEAAKHNLPVLIHAGYGLEQIADDVLHILKTCPKLRLIIGHSGFPDIDNMIKKVAKCDNVLFDTSSCKIFDVFDIIRNIDYRKISYGSDIPYFALDVSLQSVIDTAITLGKTPNQIKQILGGNVAKWF